MRLFAATIVHVLGILTYTFTLIYHQNQLRLGMCLAFCGELELDARNRLPASIDFVGIVHSDGLYFEYILHVPTTVH